MKEGIEKQLHLRLKLLTNLSIEAELEALSVKEKGERLHHKNTFCNLQGTEAHQLGFFLDKTPS